MTTAISESQKTAFDTLKGDFAYSNVMQTPKITKVVVSTGTGKISDKNKIKLIEDRMAKITGQKAAPRAAKKSIATFKLREGEVIGYQVTLRGQRMHDFLNKLIHVTLPRMRDFRGISENSIDEIGNLTIGLREHTIFPETSDEELKDVFGLAITVVTTAKEKKEAAAFFKHLGFPIKEKK